MCGKEEEKETEDRGKEEQKEECGEDSEEDIYREDGVRKNEETSILPSVDSPEQTLKGKYI